jgi:hypothetical protein
MPYTFGDGELEVDQLDGIVDADEPLEAAHATGPDAAATRIGELVAERVVDGSTLQLGIGAVPNATLPDCRTVVACASGARWCRTACWRSTPPVPSTPTGR